MLTEYLRRELMSRKQIVAILGAADQALSGSEHFIDEELVLDVVAGSRLTAHDAEFVALASALAVPLVTADTAVLRAFPDRALTMQAVVRRRRSGPSNRRRTKLCPACINCAVIEGIAGLP